MERLFEVLERQHIRNLNSRLPEAEKLLENGSVIEKDMLDIISESTSKLEDVKFDRKLPSDRKIDILLGRALVFIQKYQIQEIKQLSDKSVRMAKRGENTEDIRWDQRGMIQQLEETRNSAKKAGAEILEETTKIIKAFNTPPLCFAPGP